MPIRVRNVFIWTVVHAVGCAIGLLGLAYGVVTWAGYGFALGPGRLHPGAPDPSGGARYFFLAGLTISAYCAFALYIGSGPSRRAESEASDDGTSASNQSLEPTAGRRDDQT